MLYERLAALENGKCIKIDNSLNSVGSISFELENNKRYEDHVSVYNARELVIEGSAYSNNNRVVIKEQEIKGKAVDIVFTINTIDLKDSDTIEGVITVISNVGIINIPYKYTIISSNILKVVENFTNITDYYDYFIKDAVSAKALFTSKEFFMAPFMQDEFARGLYETLCKGSNINIAIIEFFKAFEIDAVVFFKDIDQNVTKKYIDDALNSIDLSNTHNKELNDILSHQNENEIEETDNFQDEITAEAKELVKEIRDNELLNVIASMCVRNNYIDEIAFSIYLKVIEKGSEISGIYDKFILSIPEDYNMALPLYLYRYYFEDRSFTFEDKLRLYENIISAFNENDDVYKLYYQEIVEYALSRIYQNKITESLIKIYNKVLSIDIVNENNCNNVLYLLRSHKLVLSDNSIRKVIIRYKETEKETKYDVINGIAYVPIFFNSYIMLYEDVYGNRFYSEEVTIKSLFNRKEIENYIIEKFPQKDIIDMTKLMKLNELEKFSSEYEIDEVAELERNIKINAIIRDKFRDKIIDYYFLKVISHETISERAKQYLKNLQFEKLSLFTKRKVLKALLDSNEYMYVYEKVSFYGFDLIEDDDLLKLLTKCIEINDFGSKRKLLNDLLFFSKTKKLDGNILNYLANNYEGSVEDQVFIMNSMNTFAMDVSFIAKKLLMLCLECDKTEYLDHVFEYYEVSDDDDKKLLVAYLNKKATDYVLDNVETDEKYFKKLSQYIMDNFNDIDTMPIIFLIAITKYISTFKVLTNNELRRILVKSMERLLASDMIFAYFKKLNKHMQMPYYVMNKEYIEFHADKDFVPKAILSISGDEEKKEVELLKVFMNIYIKRITVFKNEIINYEIINGNDSSQGILQKGTLTYDENYELEYPSRGKMRSTFDYINDAIVSLDRDNIEGLKRAVMEMVEKQEISKKLFNI